MNFFLLKRGDYEVEKFFSVFFCGNSKRNNQSVFGLNNFYVKRPMIIVKSKLKVF